MNMSDQEPHMDFNHLLSRYLSDELSPEELAAFKEEIRADPGKQKLLDAYRKIWDSARAEPRYDLDAEWALLQDKLPGFEVDSEGAGRRMGRTVFYYTYRIAAVLVLGLMFTFSLYYVRHIAGMEKVVAGNVPLEVILEDGTEVIVNRNSSLRYSRKLDKEERKVYLRGEAWFDVARDTARPFEIDAGEALVQVLGTSFNVNAYRENPTVEITVATGLVALSAKEDEENLIVMKAGSGGSYDKTQGKLKLIPTSDPNTISWKTRELFFEGTSLKEVCELVNSVYGARLIIMNQELAACPITVTFRDQSLESVLSVIESTLDLQLSRVGDEIRLDGEGCIE